jgi:hypothetical protein
MEHYKSFIPRIFGVIAITFGNHIFYSLEQDKIPDRLRKHEMEHVRQYRRDGFVGFLVRYLTEYFTYRLKGFTDDESYSKIKYEVEAVNAERSTDGAEK